MYFFLYYILFTALLTLVFVIYGVWKKILKPWALLIPIVVILVPFLILALLDH